MRNTEPVSVLNREPVSVDTERSAAARPRKMIMSSSRAMRLSRMSRSSRSSEMSSNES